MQNIYSYRPIFNSNDTLIHYGVKGMKWDERKRKGKYVDDEYLKEKNYNNKTNTIVLKNNPTEQDKAHNYEVFRNAQKAAQAEKDQKVKDNNYNSIVQTAGQIQNRIREIANNPVSKFISKNIVPKSTILKSIRDAVNRLNADFNSGAFRTTLRKQGVNV